MNNSTRRGFLAGLSVPAILGAADKGGGKRPIVGEGAYRYEAIHDWGELPASIKYGNTHGVVEDSQGRIYVHHTVNKASESHDSMVVFDEKGKFVKSWGKQFKGGAHGLHIAKEGRNEFLYLCDTARGVVVKATPDGEEVFSIGYPEQSDAYKPGEDGKKKKYSPTNLALAPNGDIYVGDGYGSHFINVYDSKGTYKLTFGGQGSEPGKVSCPHGIMIDTRASRSGITILPLCTWKWHGALTPSLNAMCLPSSVKCCSRLLVRSATVSTGSLPRISTYKPCGHDSCPAPAPKPPKVRMYLPALSY